jgi:tetratricopeptide (TPR) repeat protein
MSRQHLSAWLSKLHRGRGLLLALLLLLGIAGTSGPWLGAWYHLRQGRIELQRYHPDKARRHLEAYLRLWPHNVTAHLLAARAARQMGAYDEAEEHLRQAQREQREPSEEVVLEWTLHRATLGDLDRTEPHLLPLTREDSERALLACEALATGYRRTYRIPQALTVLEIWLERRPNHVQALLLRGHLWGQINVFRRAIPDYQRVLEQEPEREEARRWLALCLVESSRWHEALPHLEDLHRQHPDDRDICVLLASCWSDLGQAEQARQILQAVLVERPDDPLALRSLGRTLLQEQQLAEAETCLRRAIAVAPYDYKAQWFLYEALRQQDKTTEAESQLERTQQLERRWTRYHEITQQELSARPLDVALHAELGSLLLDLGYTDAGRNWLLNAVHRDPQCRFAHEALARYYQQQGDAEKAAQHQRQVRAIPTAITNPAPPRQP